MQELNLLAIETATNACSVALEGAGSSASRYELGKNIHSQLLLQMVAEVLSEVGINTSQLHAVAVGQGPGSFTGLRIGVGVAQGLAYAANCPMVGVSSLAALAWAVTPSIVGGPIIAGIDARMGEVYWAEYRFADSQLTLVTDISVSPPTEIASNAKQPILVGNAWAEYQTVINKDLLARADWRQQIVYPHADAILSLGRDHYLATGGVTAAEFQADYVRNQVAKKSVVAK